MAHLADVVLSESWVDLHVAALATAGATLQIQNKGSNPILLLESATAPAAGSDKGFVIEGYQLRVVAPKAGEKVFVRTVDTLESVAETSILAVMEGA